MTHTNSLHQAAWDYSAQHEHPGPRGPNSLDADEIDKLRAAGVPRAQLRNVHLELDRNDLARILAFIEQRAIDSDNYHEVRQAVLFSEMLRDQARPQLT